MEQQLQPPQAPEPSTVLSDKHNGHTTRGLNISTKYMELMSKNRREEVEREMQQEASKPSITETDVLCLWRLFSKRSLF